MLDERVLFYIFNDLTIVLPRYVGFRRVIAVHAPYGITLVVAGVFRIREGFEGPLSSLFMEFA